ncbi:hypothetical protein JOM56_008467 [Amanita muscaria]
MKTIDQYFLQVACILTGDVCVKRQCQFLEASRTLADNYHRHQAFSRDQATEFLLRTLSSPYNPITHSDIPERADRVVSTATGHQVAEERMNRRLYLEGRERKLLNQREKASDQKSQVLRQTRIYLDGYLEDTTDIEIKRLIVLAGGQALQTSSECTHIVTSRSLSGSKMQTLLAGRNITKIHIVKPEWVVDSVTRGKRQPEYRYSILQDILQ